MAQALQASISGESLGFSAVSPLSDWALDPALTHLNHGAFGGVPNVLRAEQQRWQGQLDANPSRFIMDELFDRLAIAAVPLAAFVGTQSDRLAFVENASAGMATVLAGVDFEPGDRVVTTTHVYGAVRNMLTELSLRRGIVVVEAEIACPLHTADRALSVFADALADGVRLVVLDHVASASSVILPITQMIALCHDRAIPVLVDGSHAPGMLDLDIDAIGADWYVGNCHKWLCAPRGVAFLAIAPNAPAPHPMVISHAYGMGFAAEFRKVGTRDPSAMLTVPAALSLHHELGGAQLRQRNQDLASVAADLLCGTLGGQVSAPAAMRGAMATLSLPGMPATRDAATALRLCLREQHRIEVLALPFAGQLWLRISAHAYNSLADYEQLAAVLPEAIGTLAGAAA